MQADEIKEYITEETETVVHFLAPAEKILEKSKEFKPLAEFIQTLPFKTLIKGQFIKKNETIFTEKIYIPLNGNTEAINNLFLQIYLTMIKNNQKYTRPNITIKEQYLIMDFPNTIYCYPEYFNFSKNP
jgi:hypothetical protein